MSVSFLGDPVSDRNVLIDIVILRKTVCRTLPLNDIINFWSNHLVKCSLRGLVERLHAFKATAPGLIVTV